MFYRDERLALFIDGSNLYAATKALGFDIDYKRLLKLGFLAPDIVEAVLNGEQDAPASFRTLTKWVDAGVVWAEQVGAV